MATVVELVVRLGDTILDVAHLAPDRSYRIGTHEVSAARLAAVEHMQLGLVTIDAARVDLAPARIAAHRPDWKLPLYVAASLTAHVALWLAAALLEPFERLADEPAQPRMRHAHVTVEIPPEPPPPPAPAQPPPQPQPPDPGARAARRASKLTRVEAASEAVPATFGTAAREVANMVENLDVVRRVGELRPEDTYNEDEANARGFGGGRRFTPPAESIESGAYQTLPLDVTLCPNKSCSVRGPVPALFIRTHLHTVMPAIYGCYAQHATGPGTITLEFTIDVDGGVKNMRGSGLGETGACAARAASELYFKALGKDVKPGQSPETHVRYPIRFNDH